MIQRGLWQEQAIQDVSRLLEADANMRALLVTGSAARAQGSPDTWSDVDAVVVLTGGVLDRFYPDTRWLNALGSVYGLDQSSSEHHAVTRVCFSDFRRIDFIFIAESHVATIGSWPYNPLWEGARVIFSRSPAVNAALRQSFRRPAYTPMAEDAFQEMVRRFWLKGMLATSKVMRTDLLIALHLALDLVRDCCVLGMILRDRAEGTTHHKSGGSGNLVVERLAVTQRPYTAAGILNSIEQSSIAFDALAAEWSPAYQEQCHPLLAWIAYAREALGQ